MTPDWVIVTRDFTRLGGQSKANYALASFLAERGGATVHVVAHRVDEPLASHRAVRVHRVPHPLGSDLLTDPVLDHVGRGVARAVVASRPGARIVVNGASCRWPDVNWVHFVQHAWAGVHEAAPLALRLKDRFVAWSNRRRERRALAASRLVVANSQRTRRDLVELLGVPDASIEVVYLGTDPGTFGPVTAGERAAARSRLGAGPDRSLVAFVGGIATNRLKGFDTLLAAWRRLCDRGDWDALLVAAGGGTLAWAAREIERLGLSGSVRLLGETDRVPEVLAAADLLVSPTRYDSYGLNVQEALCRGVPAIVSTCAGVSERYTPELAPLLLRDPESPDELAECLREWRRSPDRWRSAAERLGAELRAWTWSDMAGRIVERIEAKEPCHA